jgi:hypothetical protein
VNLAAGVKETHPYFQDQQFFCSGKRIKAVRSFINTSFIHYSKSKTKQLFIYKMVQPVKRKYVPIQQCGGFKRPNVRCILGVHRRTGYCRAHKDQWIMAKRPDYNAILEACKPDYVEAKIECMICNHKVPESKLNHCPKRCAFLACGDCWKKWLEFRHYDPVTRVVTRHKYCPHCTRPLLEGEKEVQFGPQPMAGAIPVIPNNIQVVAPVIAPIVIPDDDATPIIEVRPRTTSFDIPKGMILMKIGTDGLCRGCKKADSECVRMKCPRQNCGWIYCLDCGRQYEQTVGPIIRCPSRACRQVLAPPPEANEL